MAAERRGGGEGRREGNVRFIERGKPGAFETCPRRISRPPLKKMKRPTSSSRRESALGKAKGEEGGVKGE